MRSSCCRVDRPWGNARRLRGVAGAGPIVFAVARLSSITKQAYQFGRSRSACRCATAVSPLAANGPKPPVGTSKAKGGIGLKGPSATDTITSVRRPRAARMLGTVRVGAVPILSILMGLMCGVVAGSGCGCPAVLRRSPRRSIVGAMYIFTYSYRFCEISALNAKAEIIIATMIIPITKPTTS